MRPRPQALGRHIRFPIWARFLTGAAVIVGSVGTATAATLLLDVPVPEPIPSAPELPPVGSGEPQTILVVGSDRRPEAKQGGAPGLSDTTMLARIDPDDNEIRLLSLPRDLRVEIPGRGTGRLNEAYADGGPVATYEAVRELTGVEINHLVDVEFEGFARAVNEIDCVYVDVDRRYFNSNDDAGPDYEEIDLQPGYQALCGFDALDYVRYRHTDHDLVRAARQQAFLREARQKLPAEVLLEQRKELVDIFTEHTRSDIDDVGSMLQLLKVLLATRGAPVEHIELEARLGPAFVTASEGAIATAVARLLGEPDPFDRPADDGGAAGAVAEEDDPVGEPDAGLAPTSYGHELARQIGARRVRLPVYYPTRLEAGSDFAQRPRTYKINGTGVGAPPPGERAAYKWVFTRPGLGEYYGFMATRWRDPPILESPTETREIGDREYELFFDGEALRLVAWRTEEGSFWLSNTLTGALSPREMVAIATSFRELPDPRG